MFNKVITAQYFIWPMTFLPLIIPRVNITKTRGILMMVLWMCSELHWNFWGYHLEFKGLNVFPMLWCASAIFFGMTTYVLITLLKNTVAEKEEIHKE
jgi:phosphatidylinositol glycan class M